MKRSSKVMQGSFRSPEGRSTRALRGWRLKGTLSLIQSPTFVIAYCMKKLFTDFRTAFHLVKRIRKGICPNLGFEKQLKQYERELLLSESKAEIKPEQTDITMHCKQKELFQPKHTNLTFVGKT